jgi:hypothetical protein
MSTNKSKTVVFPNGDIHDLEAIKEVLKAYWRLNKTERKAFRITMKNFPDPQEFIDEEKPKP